MPAVNWSGGASQITKPATYTATLSSATNATQVIKWYRLGQFLILEGVISWSGVGGAGNFSFTLPGAVAGSPLIDTASISGGTSSTNQGASILGTSVWFHQGVGWNALYAQYLTTTTINFATATQIFDSSQTASGDSIKFIIDVPIVGWS